MVMGVLMTVMVLEATRRVIGWALPITAIVFLFYGLFIARLEPMRMLDQLYMTTEGIFGIPLSVSAAYVLIFVLFGSFMERTGTGQLFMDFAMSLTGAHRRRPRQGVLRVVGAVRHHLRQRGRQRHGRRADHHSADEALRLSAAFRRRRRGGGLDRRADHAADHGRRRLRDGRVPRRVLRTGGDLGDHSGGALLRRLLLGRAFRGQAPRPGRRAAQRIAQARRRDARARPHVPSGAGDPGRDVFRLQRADGGAGRHARLLPGGGVAQVDAPLRHASRISSRPASTAPRMR